MRVICFLMLLVCCVSCRKQTGEDTRRKFRMGFQSSAPRPDIQLALQSLYTWTARSDAAIISTEVPWDSLYGGVPAADYAARHYKDLADFYHANGLSLWLYLDPVNGLDRSSDASTLRVLGKSIAMDECQAVFADYVKQVYDVVKPQHTGLALEVNLIRALSPDSVYQGVVDAATLAAQDLKAAYGDLNLSVSVQADWAWGFMDGTGFKGIDQELNDFSFINELGISSYPYFNLSDPAQLPLHFYSRLKAVSGLPVGITESGWATVKAGPYESGQHAQAAYLKRQAEMLQQADALAWFQLTFTDIDVQYLLPGTPVIINEFATIGLLDKEMHPKLALATWDSIYGR